MATTPIIKTTHSTDTKMVEIKNPDIQVIASELATAKDIQNIARVIQKYGKSLNREILIRYVSGLGVDLSVKLKCLTELFDDNEFINSIENDAKSILSCDITSLSFYITLQIRSTLPQIANDSIMLVKQWTLFNDDRNKHVYHTKPLEETIRIKTNFEYTILKIMTFLIQHPDYELLEDDRQDLLKILKFYLENFTEQNWFTDGICAGLSVKYIRNILLENLENDDFKKCCDEANADLFNNKFNVNINDEMDLVFVYMMLMKNQLNNNLDLKKYMYYIIDVLKSINHPQIFKYPPIQKFHNLYQYIYDHEEKISSDVNKTFSKFVLIILETRTRMLDLLFDSCSYILHGLDIMKKETAGKNMDKNILVHILDSNINKIYNSMNENKVNIDKLTNQIRSNPSEDIDRTSLKEIIKQTQNLITALNEALTVAYDELKSIKLNILDSNVYMKITDAVKLTEDLEKMVTRLADDVDIVLNVEGFMTIGCVMKRCYKSYIKMIRKSSYERLRQIENTVGDMNKEIDTLINTINGFSPKMENESNMEIDAIKQSIENILNMGISPIDKKLYDNYSNLDDYYKHLNSNLDNYYKHVNLYLRELIFGTKHLTSISKEDPKRMYYDFIYYIITSRYLLFNKYKKNIVNSYKPYPGFDEFAGAGYYKLIIKNLVELLSYTNFVEPISDYNTNMNEIVNILEKCGISIPKYGDAYSYTTKLFYNYRAANLGSVIISLYHRKINNNLSMGNTWLEYISKSSKNATEYINGLRELLTNVINKSENELVLYTICNILDCCDKTDVDGMVTYLLLNMLYCYKHVVNFKPKSNRMFVPFIVNSSVIDETNSNKLGFDIGGHAYVKYSYDGKIYILDPNMEFNGGDEKQTDASCHDLEYSILTYKNKHTFEQDEEYIRRTIMLMGGEENETSHHSFIWIIVLTVLTILIVSLIVTLCVKLFHRSRPISFSIVN